MICFLTIDDIFGRAGLKDMTKGVWSVFVVFCPGGGGGTPLYGLYRYVRPQRVWFFSRFGHK